MIMWLILGYLVVSTLTFLFVYPAYAAAARADYRQEPDLVNQFALPEPAQRVPTYGPTETFSLSGL